MHRPFGKRIFPILLGAPMAQDRRHAGAESAEGNMYSTEDNCRKGDSMFNTMQKQIRQVVLGAMVATATLTGGASPKKTERSSFVPGQKASTYQMAKAPLTGRRGTTSPNRTNARSSKQAPAVQKGEGVTNQAVKTASSGSWQTDPMDAPPQKVSIPWMPELKFSNKFSACPVPEIQNAEYYINGEFLTDLSKNSFVEGVRCHNVEVLRVAGPYVPDIFYEKSKLPYAERMKFYESSEKKAIMKALKERFETNIGVRKIFGRPLMEHILNLSNEVLIFGRPLASLPTETESLRTAVDLCGLTQAGYWMDIQKAKNREFKDIVPEGYDKAEFKKQWNDFSMLKRVYHYKDYYRAIGIMPEKCIREDVPYYSEA